MTNNKPLLPQLGQQLFLTDGGIETTMIFHHGIDLPEFATFTLLESEAGVTTIRDYYRRYLDLAVESGMGFVLEGATWRANRDWGLKLGYSEDDLAAVNRKAVRLMQDLRDEYRHSGIPVLISGNVGPRGDGYVTGERISVERASAYHEAQIRTFAEAAVDRVTALTLTYAEEAAGIVLAANRHGLPSVIGFTTETDGRLPSGLTLREAIETVDRLTAGGPAYYMVNCAHPDHFSSALAQNESWTARIRGVRANASRLSHAELDESEVLDDGDPLEFGDLHRRLRDKLPKLSVFGGCCGTDHRHVQAVRQAIS